MSRKLQLVAFLAAALSATSGMAQNTQRGAAVGGIMGAIAGGIIGDHNDEAGAGAAIGGAIGVVTGAVIGNAQDKEQAYARARVQQQYQHQQVVVARQAVTVADVISMSRSGLSDSVIINQIQQRGVQQRLEVPDIITLHQQGVHESVITMMQQASIGPPPSTYVAPVQATPVIVEERYRVVPTYVVPAPRYYHAPPHHHHYHRGHSFGMSYGF